MYLRLLIVAAGLATLIGCAKNQAPDVSGNIRNSLKQAGLSDVTVSQDRTKGVVTLGGTVQSDADKTRAEQIAMPSANGQVVANEISVQPSGTQSSANTVNSDLDKGIQSNLDAVLTQANIKGIHHTTKNGVVTLTGNLNSPTQKANAERVAAAVPNVQQVVNEIELQNQNQPATGTSADRSKQ